MLSNQELQSSTLKELQAELQKALAKLHEIRIQIRTKHMADVSLAGKWKRYVAKLKTFIRDAELDEQVKAAA